MVSKDKLLSVLPPFRDEWAMLHPDQSVHNIIDEVLNAHLDFGADYDKIALYFDADSVPDICEGLFEFCRNELEYLEETEAEQTVASPGAMLSRGKCDCKGYSGWIAGCLSALCRKGIKIKWKYRFASYDFLNKSPHHVFVVVDFDGSEIWVDPTPGADKKIPVWQVDKTVGKNMALYKITGFDEVGKIGDTTSTSSTTTSGVDSLSAIFTAFASGGDPATAIASFATSPQAGQLIQGIVNNINILVDGIKSIFTSDREDELIKAYKLYPINTGTPSYVQIDSQINAIKASLVANCYIWNTCKYGSGDDQKIACAWVAAQQSVIASYGTLSTWLKVQEAVNKYAPTLGGSVALSSMINPLMIGAGALLYLTAKGKKPKKVTGSKSNSNVFLIGGAAAIFLLMMKKDTQAPEPVLQLPEGTTTEPMVAADAEVNDYANEFQLKTYNPAI